MLHAFDDGPLRILIKYWERPVRNGREFERIPDAPSLIKQENFICDVEIININTKEIVKISKSTALAIAANIEEISKQIVQPIHESGIDY